MVCFPSCCCTRTELSSCSNGALTRMAWVTAPGSNQCPFQHSSVHYSASRGQRFPVWTWQSHRWEKLLLSLIEYMTAESVDYYYYHYCCFHFYFVFVRPHTILRWRSLYLAIFLFFLGGEATEEDVIKASAWRLQVQTGIGILFKLTPSGWSERRMRTCLISGVLRMETVENAVAVNLGVVQSCKRRRTL